jgi:tetratricopeptide (TPR) repeat protein
MANRGLVVFPLCLAVVLGFQPEARSLSFEARDYFSGPRDLPGRTPGFVARAPEQTTAAELRTQALELAYNLDHEEAIELLRKAIALAPDDPAPHRTLASVLWLHMLFLRGAVTVDHYLGSFNRARVEMKKPPPDVAAEFRKHLQIAVNLARGRVQRNPRDPQARYDLGAALGLEASYIATVEGKLLAGFKAARRTFDEHERALELDSGRHDAALVVGLYRYIVSTLSLPMRFMAYVAGFGGGKERGITLLQQAANGGGEARTDALFALILVYNREKRFDDALKLLGTLRQLYPRNRLVVLEQGSTALRGGKAAEAERSLSEGLRMLQNDTRRRIPGEEALWRYKRGTARAALGRADAVDDLRAATAPQAQEWVAGRARVELARLALRKGDKKAADAELKLAESLCQNGNDPACVEEARKLARSADGG